MKHNTYIRLFNSFSITMDGKYELELKGYRMQSILAYLAMAQGRSVSRSKIAGCIWPDTSEQQARTNLRRELHSLRNIHPLFAASLRGTKNFITCDIPYPASIDVCLFEYGLQQYQSEADKQKRITTGMEIENLYTGPLLPHLDDEWIVQLREKYDSEWGTLVEQLVPDLASCRRHSTAIELVKKLIRTDNLRESSYLALIQLYIDTDNSAHALQTYHDCVKVFQSELNLPPSDALASLRICIESSHQTPPHVQPTILNSQASDKLELTARKREYSILQEQLTNAASGQHQFILVSGSAGVGKTHLANCFLSTINKEHWRILPTKAMSPENELPFKPILTWLRSLPLDQLIPSLTDPYRFELACAFPELIALDKPVTQMLTHHVERSRARLFEALVQLFWLNKKGLIFFIDEIGWADRDTLEWLSYLWSQSKDRPLLVIASMCAGNNRDPANLEQLISSIDRTGFLCRIDLQPLNQSQSLTLAKRLLENAHDSKKSINHPLIAIGMSDDSVFELTSGYPLYIVELCRLISTGSRNISRQDIIRARLNNLNESTRELALLAAAIGSTFSWQQLAIACKRSNNTTIEIVKMLIDDGMLVENPDTTYQFSSELLRTELYLTMSVAVRQSMHSRIAATLLATKSSHDYHRMGIVSYHYKLSRERENSYLWSCRAAAYAESVMAYRNAAQNYRVALDLLRDLDSKETRIDERIKLLLAQTRAVAQLEGYCDPIVHRNCTDIQKLLPHANNSELKCKAGMLVRVTYSFGHYPRQALKVAPSVIRYARDSGKDVQIVEAIRGKSIAEFQLGLWKSSERTMTEGARIVQQTIEQNLVSTSALPFSYPALYSMWALLASVTGKMNDSFERLNAALDFAMGTKNRLQRVVLLLAQANVYQQFDQHDRVQQISEELLEIAQPRILQKWYCVGRYYGGWACAAKGQAEKGILQMETAIAEYPSTADRHAFPFWYSHLALIQLRNGMGADALKSAQLGIQVSRTTRQWVWMAELYRVYAKSLAQTGGDPQSVMQAFGTSRSISQRQGALLFELRTLTDALEYSFAHDLETSAPTMACRNALAQVEQGGNCEETRLARKIVT